MRIRQLFTFVLCAGAVALAASAADAAVRVKVAGEQGITLVQGDTKGNKAEKGTKAEKAEKGKKAKSSKGGDKAQSSERSNASGEVRGQERAQDVQGLQDSGKGAQQRGQRPSK